MKLYYFIIFSFYILNGCASSNSGLKDSNCSSYYDSLLQIQVYDQVDSLPVYSSGNLELLKLIGSNLKLNETELTLGRIPMYFVISENGTILKVGFYGDVFESTKVKVRKLLEGMDGWVPGKCNNRVVVSKLNWTFSW